MRDLGWIKRKNGGGTTFGEHATSASQRRRAVVCDERRYAARRTKRNTLSQHRRANKENKKMKTLAGLQQPAGAGYLCAPRPGAPPERRAKASHGDGNPAFHGPARARRRGSEPSNMFPWSGLGAFPSRREASVGWNGVAARRTIDVACDDRPYFPFPPGLSSTPSITAADASSARAPVKHLHLPGHRNAFH